MTFNANGSFSVVEDYWDKASGSERWTMSGSWTTSENILTVRVEKSSDPDDIGMVDATHYTVQGNLLILGEDDLVYTRK